MAASAFSELNSTSELKVWSPDGGSDLNVHRLTVCQGCCRALAVCHRRHGYISNSQKARTADWLKKTQTLLIRIKHFLNSTPNIQLIWVWIDLLFSLDLGRENG